ncbi:MAG: multidrug efflux SMR transporter [Mycobacterium sp.]
MAWIVLIVSALFEAVWATALSESGHFTRLVPSVVFLVALIVSMAGLGWAAKSIAIGTAYALWTGIGAALTVGYAMFSGVEPISVGKLACLAGIIGSVIGLKRARHDPGRADRPIAPSGCRESDASPPGSAKFRTIE